MKRYGMCGEYDDYYIGERRDGKYVLLADHTAALAEKDRRITELEDELALSNLEADKADSLRAQLAANAAMLAKQTDLAREAECRAMEAQALAARNADAAEALEGMEKLGHGFIFRWTESGWEARKRNDMLCWYADTLLAAVRAALDAQKEGAC